MENKKTTQYLNSTAWYRALKVVYVIFVSICYLIATLSTIAFWINGSDEIVHIFNGSTALSIILNILIVPWSIFWAWLISQIPKWIFYYVYLGSIKPNKS